jgi:hypothetical protein
MAKKQADTILQQFNQARSYLEPTFRTLNCHRSKKPLK